MNCEECKAMKDKYLRGKLTAAEEQEMGAHLESCEACRKMLDDELAASESQRTVPRNSVAEEIRETFEPGLDEEKQRKILRRARYKNRFSIAVFLLLLLLGLRIAGGLLSSTYFNWGGEDSRLYNTQRTAALLTEFCFPNVTLPLYVRPLPLHASMAGWGHSSLEIKPYFMARGEYVLQKQVGKENVKIGRLHVDHLFFSVFSRWGWEDHEHQEYLYFYHPEQIDDPLQRLPIPTEPTWETMEILPEGTVAELAVSFRETYSIDRVIEMLSDYDLDITWYAVSTGQEEMMKRQDHPEPLFAFNGVWGLPHHSRSMHSQDGPVSQGNYGAFLEDYFLDSMEHLVENERLARRVFRGDPARLRIPERYDYVQENGLRVYGVVVTGPTRELLKLKELETIHSPALGEIRLWNWFHRSFQGTMY